MVFHCYQSLIQGQNGPLDKVDTTYFISHCIGLSSYLKIICCVDMRKLVVYITRNLNVKLALSFYIYMYICISLHAESVFIFLPAQTVDTNYCYKPPKCIERGFLIKISWGSMPPDPPDCARRKLCAAHELCASAQIVRRAQIVRCTETEPPSTMMLSHFSGGNPA